MPRRGYSLLELVAVVAMLAVLIGLVLSGIQKARQAAVAADNRDHVRQMMLAVHNYATAHGGKLPCDPAFASFHLKLVTGGGGNPATPYFDFQTAPLNYAFTGPRHGEPDRVAVRLYVNPADPSWWYYTAGTNPLVGDTGYAANAVVFAAESDLTKSFPDGTSNTLAVAERYARCRTPGHPMATNLIWTQSHVHAWGQPTVLGSRNPRPPNFADKFYDDTVPVTEAGRTRGSRPGRPFQLAPAPPDCDPIMPQATAAHGLVVGLIDGSVRTVSGGVDADLFWAAVTPAAGDVGGLD